jgi:hypothetical protein
VIKDAFTEAVSVYVERNNKDKEFSYLMMSTESIKRRNLRKNTTTS